jgi:hypothetical protein
MNYCVNDRQIVERDWRINQSRFPPDTAKADRIRRITLCSSALRANRAGRAGSRLDIYATIVTSTHSHALYRRLRYRRRGRRHFDCRAASGENTMIKVSVMYPYAAGARFDHAYYREKYIGISKN